MKNQLSYQTSEYDCGPTTLINAIRYLYDREEILPEILKSISLYTLDAYDENGVCGKSGTSCMAMLFLSHWLNQFGRVKKFPICTEIIQKENLWIGPGSKILECISQGGVAILCVWLGEVKHYVLITDVEEEYLCLFDPYDWEEPVDGDSVIKVGDQPKKMNRKVKIVVINSEGNGFYALGRKEDREAMLLFNKNSRFTHENSIEYFL